MKASPVETDRTRLECGCSINDEGRDMARVLSRRSLHLATVSWNFSKVHAETVRTCVVSAACHVTLIRIKCDDRLDVTSIVTLVQELTRTHWRAIE